MGKTSVLSCQRLNDDIKSFAYIIWVEFDLDIALSAFTNTVLSLKTAASSATGTRFLCLKGLIPPTW